MICVEKREKSLNKMNFYYQWWLSILSLIRFVYEWWSGDPSPRILFNERKLGEGSFGSVFKVKEDDQSFALKVIKFGASQRDSKEAQLLETLDHENIVKVKDIGFLREKDEFHFELWNSRSPFRNFAILLELCDSDLKTKLETMEVVDHEWSLEMTRQLLDGLRYLHTEDVMHR